MLRRRMEADIAYRHTGPCRNTKRLDRAIDILVIDGVLVMPYARRRIGHLITYDSDTVIPGIRREGRPAGTVPGIDRRPLPDRRSGGREAERAGRTVNVVTPVRDVVVHVALAGIRLAPDVFVRGYVLSLGIIGGAHVLSRAQIGDLRQDPVCRAEMRMTAVAVVRRGGIAPRINSGERVDPGTRTEIRTGIEARAVRIRTSRSKRCSVRMRLASKTANVILQCRERVLYARLSDLFEAFVVRRASAHSIEVLRNHRVIVARV